MTTKVSEIEREKRFNENLVRQYLKYGSVDEALKKNKYDLPISYAGYQRVLNKWGVIKAAGPNSKLSESVEFLSHLSRENLPFEELYRRMPPSFQTSAATLYRVLSYMKEGITRRVGTALIITPFNNNKKILIAKDRSIPRVGLGKLFGDNSLPMGFARKRDTRRVAVTRILQQEVFTELTIKGKFPYELVKNVSQPFMYLDIADVRVAVFHLQLPQKLSSRSVFSSYKLRDFNFKTVEEITSRKVDGHYRVGILEAVNGFERYLNLLERKLKVNPFQAKSQLNRDFVFGFEMEL